MTTPATSRPGDRDPVTDLLDRIRSQNTPDGASEVNELTTGAAEDFDALATKLPTDAFDPTVLAAVERLVNDSESVGVLTRRRLIAGAERGVRWHRRLAGPLPPLLQDHRRLHQVTIAAITEASELSEAVVHAVERGDTAIDELAPRQLAAWIRTVQLPSAAALDALKRSLRLPDASTVYAASGNRTETTELAHRQFYEEVVQVLTAAEPPSR